MCNLVLDRLDEVEAAEEVEEADQRRREVPAMI